jgi:hypothetical protein
MSSSNRDRVRRALELLGESLDPFITGATRDKIPDGKDWTMLLAAKDVGKGASASKKYNPMDPQNGLRMLTETLIPGGFVGVLVYLRYLPRQSRGR